MGTVVSKLYFHAISDPVLDADLRPAPKRARLGHRDPAASHASAAVGYTGKQSQCGVFTCTQTHDQTHIGFFSLITFMCATI